MKSAASREVNEIRAQYEAHLLSAWAKTDELFGLIRDDRLLAKPIVWRHPFLFYVGHLPAFSWNQICASILKWQSFNPHFDELFCRGIDPDIDTGECHWHPEVPDEWPTLMQTKAYRDRVRGAILESLEAVSRGFSDDVMAQGGRVFDMVLEHEYMHQETLLYMMQELPLEKKNRPALAPRYAFNTPPASRSIHVPAGKARLGARFNELDFGWDNEFSAITVDVPSFDIDSLPVTNGEFFEFVESGGYDEERFWLPDDWKWKQVENNRHPNCWIKQNNEWFYRAMFDHLPLSKVASWPVYVSLAEARAFARWRGKRLPSEAEFHRAAFYGPAGRELLSLGRSSADFTPRQLQFRFLVSRAGGIPSSRSQPVGGGGTCRQRLGADRYCICPFPRLRAVYYQLSGLLQRFFRRQTFCRQRRLVGDGFGIGSSELSQLVSGSLFLCVREVSLRVRMTFAIKERSS
jgi:gamma-glutamyl hercynylcysteine S-oxide synthase